MFLQFSHSILNLKGGWVGGSLGEWVAGWVGGWVSK